MEFSVDFDGAFPIHPSAFTSYGDRASVLRDTELSFRRRDGDGWTPFTTVHGGEWGREIVPGRALKMHLYQFVVMNTRAYNYVLIEIYMRGVCVPGSPVYGYI